MRPWFCCIIGIFKPNAHSIILCFLFLLFQNKNALSQENNSGNDTLENQELKEKIPKPNPARLHYNANVPINTDSLFKRAKNLAFNGKRAQARNLCKVILGEKPGNNDVRTFMARTYGWGHLYKKAKDNLNIVLESEPGNQDAIDALADVELWSANPEKAIELSNKALNSGGNKRHFQLKIVKANISLGNYDEAKVILKEILKDHPGDREAEEYLNRVNEVIASNSVAFSYGHEFNGEPFPARNFGYLEYSKRTKPLTILAKTNFLERSGKKGMEYEMEIYTSSFGKYSGYFSSGWSASEVFPNFRYGAELYKKLPRAFEAGPGYRYIAFNGEKFMIYNLTINKYWNEYMFSIRPYLVPRPAGWAHSYLFQARKYFRNPLEFFSLILVKGISPDFINYGRYYEQIYNRHSESLGLVLQLMLVRNLVMRTNITAERQETTFENEKHFYSLRAEAGLKLRF